MKKIVIILFVVLLLAGAGGGAYYYFFMMNSGDDSAQVDEEAEPVETSASTDTKPEVVVNLDYFVTSRRLNVREYPRGDASIRSVLRHGEPIKAIEVKGEWVRISDYEVDDSGDDVADWVHQDFLSHDKPEADPKAERAMLLSLIKKSDDLPEYEALFIRTTKALIDSNRCSIEDFELLGGWVRSVTFNIEPVYFVYCGGTDTENKIYLDIDTKQVFQP